MPPKMTATVNRPISIDAMLDMERQEVLALLEQKNQLAASPNRIRSSSPFTTAPHSPVRSLLEIEEEGPVSTRTTPLAQAPVRSMLDVDGPVSATQPPVRSMLDLDTPSPRPATAKAAQRSPSPLPAAEPLSPTSSSHRSWHPRSMSDTSSKPADLTPPLALGSRNDRTSEYQFSGILPHPPGHAASKRASQGTKRLSGGALGEALRGPDLSGLQIPGERGRHSAIGIRLGSKSKSPQSRWSLRSRSPALSSPLRTSNRAVLDDGQVLNINNAYRRLSDANLASSSGALSQLPLRRRSQESGKGRLVKDYLSPDGEQLDSSGDNGENGEDDDDDDDDDDVDDDDDDPSTSDGEDRGRKPTPRSLDLKAPTDSGPNLGPPHVGNQGKRPSLSLLAAADEERSQVASQVGKYQYRSLIPEPEIKITTSSGDTIRPSKGGIHPNTSYYPGTPSATPSVVDSDEEADMDDIKRAQKLSFSMTNTLTNPDSHRSVRIIYRGEYNRIVQQAEEENHRLRKYLVATDLSDESSHALEWAIGTVLRDGDTLIAICCIDEETGIVSGDGAMVPDEAKAMRDQAAAINSMANAKLAPAPVNVVNEPAKRVTVFHSPGSSPGPLGRGDRGRAEEERQRAIQDVTNRVLRLLRKTRLQVRVVVEALHCKNPRHLITEVIDLVNPTLVVIGSRGRSALKGVILGSFSNYLVTKSSVPVMVARKRLRKQSKYKRTPVRLVNNLSNPAAKSLANAKID